MGWPELARAICLGGSGADLAAKVAPTLESPAGGISRAEEPRWRAKLPNGKGKHADPDQVRR